ncbi:MAG: DHA2 family efflux MFS transporter permease subunit, partial [Actinobacteria bacterium]|nr:DHA2 family efflux MFS transporter permease subunit [Actinomycetota bacterium]
QRRWAILATMCLSLVLIVATVSSVNVAIPALSSSALRPSATQVLWIVDAYALVFAALLLPAGALGDRFGRKGALLVGLVIFAVASATCAFMKDTTALITCRAIMGIGAALIMPSTLSLLQSAFPRRERTKAIATWAGFAGAGGAIGPVMGGLLEEHFWYGSVFFVAAPIAAVAFVASAILAPASKEPVAHKLDPLGAVFSIVGFAALLAAIIEGPERGWSDTLVVAGFVIAAVGLVGFVFYERRTNEPMLDMKFFRNRRFAMGAMGITVSFFAMFSLFFLLTQYLQYVQGYTPLQSGLRGVPFAVTMVILAPRAPAISARIGAKKAVAGGMLLFVVGLVLFSQVEISTSYWYVVACLILCAAGVANVMPSLSSGIVQSVPLHKAGVGSAVNDTTREVGGAIGIAVIGSIVNSIYRSHASSAIDTLAAIPGLPKEAVAATRLNVGAALRVVDSAAAHGVPANVVDGLRTQLRQSFVDGLHTALLVGAAVALVGAVIMYIRLPDGGAHHEHNH